MEVKDQFHAPAVLSLVLKFLGPTADADWSNSRCGWSDKDKNPVMTNVLHTRTPGSRMRRNVFAMVTPDLLGLFSWLASDYYTRARELQIRQYTEAQPKIWRELPAVLKQQVDHP
jgi:hypothetical protein